MVSEINTRAKVLEGKISKLKKTIGLKNGFSSNVKVEIARKIKIMEKRPRSSKQY